MSFDLVLFGGTGDLTWRKLMPALFQALLSVPNAGPCTVASQPKGSCLRSGRETVSTYSISVDATPAQEDAQ